MGLDSSVELYVREGTHTLARFGGAVGGGDADAPLTLTVSL
jgi:hypothetical protein